MAALSNVWYFNGSNDASPFCIGGSAFAGRQANLLRVATCFILSDFPNYITLAFKIILGIGRLR